MGNRAVTARGSHAADARGVPGRPSAVAPRAARRIPTFGATVGLHATRLQGLLILTMGLAMASPLAAQDGRLHVLVVTGLSGEPSFAASFATAGGALVEAARGPWGVADADVTWLAEDASRDAGRITGRATGAAIDSALSRLAARSQPGDVVAVILIGHGSGSGVESKLSLPGPDPTAADYGRWLDRLAGRTVVAVLEGSGSGDFLPVLSRAGRVVITGTRSSSERNESLFGSRFAHGLASLDADADKDGRVSVLEAFQYARREVESAYQADNRLVTEHAQLDDNGDGRGSDTPGIEASGDGALSRRVTFGSAPAVSDPRVKALLAERRQLESQVEALRRRKDAMPERTYLAELEELLVEIAERTRAIRAIGEGSR